MEKKKANSRKDVTLIMFKLSLSVKPVLAVAALGVKHFSLEKQQEK